MRNIYRVTFYQIHASEPQRKEVIEMTKQECAATAKRRFSKTALIAAALVVALAGTALAAASPTLRGWFEQKWAEKTGGPMTESQSLVIDSLTQKVGESVTSGDVTVTVDSITAGGSQIWALLDVEGLEFDRNARYSFDRMRVDIVPDPSEGQFGGAGYGLGSIGITEDGRCRMLLEFSAVISTGNQLNSGDYALEIDLADLIRCRTGGAEDEILYEGDWCFSISLTAESLSPVIILEKVVVPVKGLPDQEGADVNWDLVLRDVRITSTELSFIMDRPNPFLEVTAILADGTEVEDVGRAGSARDDGTWYAGFDWPVPLDVMDIAAIRVGDTEIPLP